MVGRRVALAALDYDIVVPTIGRPSLHELLDALRRQHTGAGRVIVVDDRRAATATIPVGRLDGTSVEVLRSGGRGPAAARNVGWSASDAEWIVFLDDDVLLVDGWADALACDLACTPATGGVQGSVIVPPQHDARLARADPSRLGLARAWWATADMAYRRAALEQVGGFDERFPRAYREDADLAVRVQVAGWNLEFGQRAVLHPTRDARWWDSVRHQLGNYDDAMMRRLYGPRWRALTGAPRDGFVGHVETTAALAIALGAAFARRRRLATLAGAAWVAATGELAWSRLAPGAHDRSDIAAVLATSAAIPLVAVGARLYGEVRARAAELTNPDGVTAGRGVAPPAVPAARSAERRLARVP